MARRGMPLSVRGMPRAPRPGAFAERGPTLKHVRPAAAAALGLLLGLTATACSGGAPAALPAPTPTTSEGAPHLDPALSAAKSSPDAPAPPAPPEADPADDAPDVCFELGEAAGVQSLSESFALLVGPETTAQGAAGLRDAAAAFDRLSGMDPRFAASLSLAARSLDSLADGPPDAAKFDEVARSLTVLGEEVQSTCRFELS